MSVQERLVQASLRNTEILQGLNETQYAASSLKQSEAYLCDLDREIEQCDSQIKDLALKTRAEHKDHKKYEESTFRRFFYRAGGKKESFAEKASKEEREYVEALNAEVKAKSRRDEWSFNREIAKIRHAELEKANQTHLKLQAELDALYNSIFSGPTPEFPMEDQKEWAYRQACDTFATLEHRHEAEKQALHCLLEANKFMIETLHELAEACTYSRMDMWGGGTLTDMMERDALHIARNAADKVNMLVSQAQRISPETQGLGKLQIAHGHGADIWFDNIFSDMAMHDDIKSSQAQCEYESRNLRDSVERARSRETLLSVQAGEALQRLEWTRMELQQVRQEAFQRVAGPPSYDQSTVHGTPSQN